MSEQNTQRPGEKPNNDWMLRALSLSGSGFPVILTTAAGLIAGDIVGEVEYLETLQNSLADGWGERAEPLRTMFAPAIENATRLPQEHIHLRNAKLYTSTGILEVGVNGLWRGRLEQVIGHSIGRVTATAVA
ncbi:hypothetical protein Q7O56_20275 [Pseudomonas protegens]|uniref:hypothetical protein n=1 Tax=Pseudomonas protegens TaxID=380021 RepID=UPI002774883E|nr:hypothetical protein [Pseudomonas protegens]MDP9511378.1 hypothetical protein [Pseudomonas protegens]